MFLIGVGPLSDFYFLLKRNFQRCNFHLSFNILVGSHGYTVACLKLAEGYFLFWKRRECLVLRKHCLDFFRGLCCSLNNFCVWSYLYLSCSPLGVVGKRIWRNWVRFNGQYFVRNRYAFNFAADWIRRYRKALRRFGPVLHVTYTKKGVYAIPPIWWHHKCPRPFFWTGTWFDMTNIYWRRIRWTHPRFQPISTARRAYFGLYGYE